mmetsp:Transcript_5406/g.12470  ORF Transcript_5406/g.12470 Transcript_5406/m.12470 type:complete len:428 (-) Transcript_5406:81-1364(-)
MEVAQAERMEDVATPLRRRAQSPVPVTPQPLSQKRGARPAPEPKAVAPVQEEGSEGKRSMKSMTGGQKFGLVAGVAMLAFACLRLLWPTLARGLKPEEAAAVYSPATVEREPEDGPSYAQMINAALDCPGIRADVLDVLAGAPYEFGDPDDQGFYRLPRLAASAAARDEASVHQSGEEDFRKAVLQLAVTGGGWPSELKRRLLRLLEANCPAESACAEGPKPLQMEVDARFTSPRARSSGSLHQALLGLGEMTGIPLFRARADLYRSEAPRVVLSSAPITQSRDCFAFRGANSSIALRLAEHGRGGARVRQLVIQQPARWAALRPRSSPRRFAVFGLPAARKGPERAEKVETPQVDGPYTKFLGSFEYAAAGPAAQVFDLAPTLVSGIRLVFAGPEWGENYICLYRLKLFEEGGTVCSGHRVAATLH